MADKPHGFVSLGSVRRGASSAERRSEPPKDPKETHALIRQIYFRTSKRTIEYDIAHAIELLKSLPTEDERDKAAVYLDGLAQMRSEWALAEKKKRRK